MPSSLNTSLKSAVYETVTTYSVPKLELMEECFVEGDVAFVPEERRRSETLYVDVGSRRSVANSQCTGE